MMSSDRVERNDVSSEGCCDRSRLTNPSHWSYRLVVLTLLCLMTIGPLFIYDNPAALENVIIDVMHVDTTQYSLLYSLYSWPNIVLVFFGGYLIDRVFGIRVGAIVFSALVCLGQSVVVIGALLDHFWLMLLGRFIYGLGGESLTVAQNTYTVLWAKPTEISLVFGVVIGISALGSGIDIVVNNRLYNSVFTFVPTRHTRLGVVFAVGLLICLIGQLLVVILGCLDKRAERILKRKETSSGEHIRFRDIKDFPISLWLVIIINTLYYSVFYTFNGLALVFFIHKYGFTASEGNIVNSLGYIVSGLILPFSGILVDKIGFNLLWVNTGTIAALMGHLIMGFLGSNQFLAYLAGVIRGLAYAISSCAQYPMVAYLIPEHQLGTAFGILQCSMNVGFAVVAVVAGVIVDQYGFLIVEVFFAVLLCLTLIAGILLHILDVTKGNKLIMAAWTRVRLQKEEEEQQRDHCQDTARKNNMTGKLQPL